MAPMINTSGQFSACSIAIMEASAAQANCVTALPAVDVSISLSNLSTTVLLGAATVFTYEVSSHGTLTATNVAVDFVVPANLVVNSAATSIGSCSIGAGSVNCVLGDIAGQSDNTIILTTTPTTVGAGTLTATASADVDERPTNDQEVSQVTVNPAVDISVNSLAAITVQLNQSSTINVTLENLSVLDATGVTASASFGTRVNVDSATWSIGTCAIVAQQVECLAGAFTNQSNSMLSFTVTGLTDGRQSYSVTTASNEADANTANNTDSSTVDVVDPDDGGGAGAFGLPFLMFIGLSVFLIRRRSQVA
jgi:hypothetical protein